MSFSKKTVRWRRQHGTPVIIPSHPRVMLTQRGVCWGQHRVMLMFQDPPISPDAFSESGLGTALAGSAGVHRVYPVARCSLPGPCEVWPGGRSLCRPLELWLRGKDEAVKRACCGRRPCHAHHNGYRLNAGGRAEERDPDLRSQGAGTWLGWRLEGAGKHSDSVV